MSIDDVARSLSHGLHEISWTSALCPRRMRMGDQTSACTIEKLLPPSPPIPNPPPPPDKLRSSQTITAPSLSPLANNFPLVLQRKQWTPPSCTPLPRKSGCRNRFANSSVLDSITGSKRADVLHTRTAPSALPVAKRREPAWISIDKIGATQEIEVERWMNRQNVRKICKARLIS